MQTGKLTLSCEWPITETQQNTIAPKLADGASSSAAREHVELPSLLAPPTIALAPSSSIDTLPDTPSVSNLMDYYRPLYKLHSLSNRDDVTDKREQ